MHIIMSVVLVSIYYSLITGICISTLHMSLCAPVQTKIVCDLDIRFHGRVVCIKMNSAS